VLSYKFSKTFLNLFMEYVVKSISCPICLCDNLQLISTVKFQHLTNSVLIIGHRRAERHILHMPKHNEKELLIEMSPFSGFGRKCTLHIKHLINIAILNIHISSHKLLNSSMFNFRLNTLYKKDWEES
jgi:hypothetical protein